MTTLAPLWQLDSEWDELMALKEEQPELDLDDTIEGMEGAMEVKRQNVVAYMQNLEVSEQAIKDAEARMAERRKALVRRREWLEQYLIRNMQKHGITKIECPEWSLKLRQNPGSVIVGDATQVPLKYMVEKTTYTPDKKAIKAAIDAGEAVPECRVERGYRLEVK